MPISRIHMPTEYEILLQEPYYQTEPDGEGSEHWAIQSTSYFAYKVHRWACAHPVASLAPSHLHTHLVQKDTPLPCMSAMLSFSWILLSTLRRSDGSSIQRSIISNGRLPTLVADLANECYAVGMYLNMRSERLFGLGLARRVWRW